jgi:spoIIIJ-associated protein
MTMKRRFFSAPTLTQALLLAARHHGVDTDDIVYQQIEKRQGFIKAPRGVAIEVDPDAPTAKRAPQAAAPAAGPAEDAPAAGPSAAEAAAPAVEEPPTAEAFEVEPAPSAPSEALSALEPVGPVAPAPDKEVPFEPAASDEPQEHPGLASIAAEREQEAVEPAAPDTTAPESAAPQAGGDDTTTRALESDGGSDDTEAAALEVDEALREAVAEAIDELAYLAALRVQASKVESDGDSLVVEIEGPDGGRLVARGGRALLAMQHLLPRLLFARLGRSLHCHLDCEGFHSNRSARLEEMANKAAERVRRGGRSWLLEPMAPDERRLIHLALADTPDIETESVGEGFLKRVRVARVESKLAEPAS